MVEAISVTAEEEYIEFQCVALCVSQDLELEHVAPGGLVGGMAEDDFKMIRAQLFDPGALRAKGTVEFKIIDGKLFRECSGTGPCCYKNEQGE